MTAPADADDRLAAYEARQDAPEALRERVARAIADDGMHAYAEPGWDDLHEDERDVFRLYADAAIATICTPVPGVAKGDGADEAVRQGRAEGRVEALAEVAAELQEHYYDSEWVIRYADELPGSGS